MLAVINLLISFNILWNILEDRKTNENEAATLTLRILYNFPRKFIHTISGSFSTLFYDQSTKF